MKTALAVLWLFVMDCQPHQQPDGGTGEMCIVVSQKPCECDTDTNCAMKCGGNGDPEPDEWEGDTCAETDEGCPDDVWIEGQSVAPKM